MPTYYHNGSGWQLFSSTSDPATSDEIYVNTGSGFNTRILDVSIHTGSGWTSVFTAFTSPPATPTLSFSSTSQNERDNAFLSWGSVSGASGYEVWVNSEPYSNTTGTSMTVPVSPNNSDSVFNAYNFQVRSYNQYGFSSLSNTKRMTPGGIDVPWSVTYSAGIDTFLADVTASSNQNVGYIASMTFPSASNSSQAGYYRLDSMSVEIKPASGTLSPTNPPGRLMGAKIDTNAINWQNIIWDYRNGNAVSGYIPISTPVNLNSNNFGNQRIYFFVDGSSWTTSSSLNPTFGYYARNFTLQGVRSTASTYS